MSKNNLSKGVRNEFDDIDYWHKLSKNKFITLEDGSKISEYHYMKKFMHEAYGNNFDRKNPDSNILQTEDHKKWARRNNNNTNRDALSVIKKSGKMNTLFQLENSSFGDDREDWEKEFKLGSYEESFECLARHSAEDLGVQYSKTTIMAIIRIYLRIAKFLKLVRFDQRNQVKICTRCGHEKASTEFHKHATSRDGRMKKCKTCFKETR